MAEKRFSKGEAIAFGWQTMNDNLGFFIVMMLIVFAITGIPSIFANITEKSMPLVSGVMRIISQLLSIFIAPGMVAIYLKFCDGQSARYEDIFAYPHLFLRYWGASILYTLAVMGGFICLIIPGLILMVKLQFFGYFIVDKNERAIDSLKKSYALAKGLWGELVIFGFLLVLINLAGLLCLGIGLFATIPTTALAATYVYRKLTTEVQVVAAPVAPIV